VNSPSPHSQCHSQGTDFASLGKFPDGLPYLADSCFASLQWALRTATAGLNPIASAGASWSSAGVYHPSVRTEVLLPQGHLH
jgi:hypothetical protein